MEALQHFTYTLYEPGSQQPGGASPRDLTVFPTRKLSFRVLKGCTVGSQHTAGPSGGTAAPLPSLPRGSPPAGVTPFGPQWDRRFPEAFPLPLVCDPALRDVLGPDRPPTLRGPGCGSSKGRCSISHELCVWPSPAPWGGEPAEEGAACRVAVARPFWKEVHGSPSSQPPVAASLLPLSCILSISWSSSSLWLVSPACLKTSMAPEPPQFAQRSSQPPAPRPSCLQCPHVLTFHPPRRTLS